MEKRDLIKKILSVENDEELDLILDELKDSSSPPEFKQTKVKRDVWRYLAGSGYDISESQFYDHCDAGKLRPSKTDGKFKKRTVDAYAKTHLKLAATGKTIGDEVDEVARERQVNENKKLKIAIEREQFKFDQEKGKYILKDRIELELAARAGVLDAGFNNFIESNPLEIITLVKGDPAKAPDLIEYLRTNWHELLNDFASVKEFEAIFTRTT